MSLVPPRLHSPFDNFGNLGDGVPLLINKGGQARMQQSRDRIGERLHRVVNPGCMLEENAGRSAGERGIARGRIKIWCLCFTTVLSSVCYFVRLHLAYQVDLRIGRKSRYSQHLVTPFQPAFPNVEYVSNYYFIVL